MTNLIKTIEWTPKGIVIRKSWTSTSELAKYMKTSKLVVEWSLDEFGRCDVEVQGHTVTAWRPYEPTEQWPHDPFAEGEPDEYHPADTIEKVRRGATIARQEPNQKE